MNSRTRRRWIIGLASTAVAAALLVQIDLVRQNLEIVWIQLTGQEWHLRGTSRTLSMWSKAIGQSRHVIVYLPPDYSAAASSGVRYPVLYLLHGSPDPGDGWSRYGRAQEEMDRLITLERYPPMIVVMPDGNGQGTFGDSEFIDAPARQKNGRQGLKIGTFITVDVVNWIDSHYRTIKTSRGRFIGGISTGGYGAANLGLQNPDEFGTIMSFSGYYRADCSGWARPVWGYHPSPSQVYAQSPYDFIVSNPARWKDTLVVLGDGASDRLYYRQDTIRFFARLQSEKIKVYKFEFPGRHSWDLWRTLLRTSLITVRGRVPVSAT